MTVRPHSIDELIWHMGPVSRDLREPDRVRAFAAKMAALERKRNWKPSPKQVAWMRRIVAERMSKGDFELFDAE